MYVRTLDGAHHTGYVHLTRSAATIVQYAVYAVIGLAVIRCDEPVRGRPMLR